MSRTVLQWGMALIVVAVVGWGCRAGGPASSPPPERVELIEERWPNGALRLQKQVVRQKDGTLLEHGTFVTWHDNGQKAYEAVYVHGRLEGVATSWHLNGQKWAEEHYVAGKRHGNRLSWDEQGRLRKEEHFDEDRPDGTWTTWDAQGKIKAQQRFDKGVPLPRAADLPEN